ncbi:hypothetical protein AB1Y20_018444 [Prymnesium parvum]|uniref:dihydrolipoyllysine-residue succinyltransferase n=1 Tax=Prymnesium parvum TaxID=97485 RepID=A0AB34JNU8_PRYPA
MAVRLHSSLRLHSALLAAARGLAAGRASALSRAPVCASLAAPRRWGSGRAESLEVPIPHMGDSISEGTILSLLKKAGEYVGAEEVVAEVETDKVTVEVRSPAAGTISALHVEEGATVQVGAKFFTLLPGEGEAPAQTQPNRTPEKAPPPPPKPPPPPPPPKPPPPKPSEAKPAEAKPSEAAATEARETRVSMTRLRKKIAARLKDSQHTAAMLSTFNEVDLTALHNLRREYKEMFEKKHGVSLGFMSPFVAATAMALKEFPLVNAVIDGDEIVYRDYVDISVAVSSPSGLVVPVLRNVQDMSWADIEKELAALRKKANDGSLSVEDMVGGTFSVTNGGVFGSLLSTPIINPPQSAILGMHGIFQRAVAVNGNVEARPMMYIALTYDHRLIDGREAVTFLKRVKELVQDPVRFSLQV